MSTSEHKVSFWNSFVTRFALFFTTLIVFTIFLAGYLVYSKSSVVILQFAKERIKNSADLVAQSFTTLLEGLKNDVGLIASSSKLQSYINKSDPLVEEDLVQVFKEMLQNKPSYFQIALLDTNGKEIIKVIKKRGDIIQVPKQDLQEKGNLRYFQEAILLKEKQFYFSEINLNEENGVIDLPEKPTLRSATPVFKNNQIYGLVIIKMELSAFYKELDQTYAEDTRLYIIDDEGQYLYNEDHEKEFGEQRKTGIRFKDDFTVSTENLNVSGESANDFVDRQGNSYVNYIKNIAYSQNGFHHIFVISTNNTNYVLESARQVRTQSLSILLVVIILSVIFSFLFTLIYSKNIKSITQAITNYVEGKPQEKLLISNRKDELELLYKNFAQMREKIDEQFSELNQSLERERIAKNQRDEFLQNMSHELRNPLHNINGLTQLLLKNDPSKSQLPIIQALQKSASNLSGLVHDVLDYQKLVEQEVQIQYTPQNIGVILEEIYGNFQYEAAQKGLTFDLHVDDQLRNNYYLTDKLRLSQIILNLVVNALKFTHQGAISIQANLLDNNRLHMSIMDTGVGILPENLEKINDRFYQEVQELKGSVSGYGLGLSIVKQLVALFGGEFYAKSTKYVGSTFEVNLPITEAEVEQNTNITSLGTGLPRLSGNYKILHMDDDPTSLSLVKYAIEIPQLSLMQFDRLEEGLAEINQIKPDLIISDLMFNGQNSLQKLIEVHERFKRQVPILLTSAIDFNDEYQQSFFCIQKPYELTLLLDCIIKKLGEKEYEIPDFTSLYNNYDFNFPIIIKVLKLLELEIITYLNHLEIISTNGKLDDWLLLAHKLIAHTKDLKLNKLTAILEINDQVPSLLQIDMLKESMKYLLCCIRIEEKINSVD
ncbi:MAG TPA: ATP-binding protein [Saprospiraceae bacterium]|nr:ATP-binding protein [Saprospiraceae bacterium]